MVVTETRHDAPTGQMQRKAGMQPLSNGYRRYAMSLLLSIYIVNHLDRQVVNILAEPIKRDLALADWQLGLMSGLAFAVLYTTLGIPIARFAERGHRPAIIATAAAVWSGFTMLCATVQNFGQLVLARVGVGVGEAGCTPPAHSLIVDYAPPDKRSSMLAFYGMGAPLGGLLGMAFGGIIADAYGWRTAFLVAGLPGLIFALMAVTTLKEPRRALAQRGAAIRTASASFGDTLRLLSAKRSLWFLTCGNTIKAFVAYGKASFVASFFLRSHGDGVAAGAEAVSRVLGVNLQPVGFLGLSIGLLMGVFGALGFWSGGQIADRIGRGNLARYMHISAAAAALTVIPAVGLFTVPSVALALGLLGVHAFLSGLHYGPTYSIAFSVVPSHMRATTSAMMLFVVNLVALGLGPLAVGIVSDILGATAGAAEGLRWSLLAFSVLPILAAVSFWMGSRVVQGEVES